MDQLVNEQSEIKLTETSHGRKKSDFQELIALWYDIFQASPEEILERLKSKIKEEKTPDPQDFSAINVNQKGKISG